MLPSPFVQFFFQQLEEFVHSLSSDEKLIVELERCRIGAWDIVGVVGDGCCC